MWCWQLFLLYWDLLWSWLVVMSSDMWCHMTSSQVVLLLMALGLQLGRCLPETVIPGVCLCVVFYLIYSTYHTAILYSECLGEEVANCTTLHCGGECLLHTAHDLCNTVTSSCNPWFLFIIARHCQNFVNGQPLYNSMLLQHLHYHELWSWTGYPRPCQLVNLTWPHRFLSVSSLCSHFRWWSCHDYQWLPVANSNQCHNLLACVNWPFGDCVNVFSDFWNICRFVTLWMLLVNTTHSIL